MGTPTSLLQRSRLWTLPGALLDVIAEVGADPLAKTSYASACHIINYQYYYATLIMNVNIV